jgi:CRISPR-associated endoribonuclease Cas6
VRMLLHLTSDSPIDLPINYQDLLVGFIYQNISDEQYRHFLHEIGYEYGNRAYRHFAFSRIYGRKKVDRERKRIIFYPPFRLWVTSPLNEFLKSFAKSMLLSEHLRIGNFPVRLLSFETMPDMNELPDTIRIRMLSPLVIYSTLTHPNGVKYTYYYQPYHEHFSAMVGENLKRRYFSVHKEDRELFESPFSIRPLHVTLRDKVITRFRGTIIEGWMGEYELSGDPRLLHWAYHTCLGGKGSQGFGVFELL